MTRTVYLEVAKRPSEAGIWPEGHPFNDRVHPWRATGIYPSAAMKPGWVWDRLYIAMPEETAEDFLDDAQARSRALDGGGEAMTDITIEEGKFYRTRDGRKVGPMRRYHDAAFDAPQSGRDFFPTCWWDDGSAAFDQSDDPNDLIAEWPDEPRKLRDMTDADIGALVRAGRDGRQRWGAVRSVWDDDWRAALELDVAYRIKPPEPVVGYRTILMLAPTGNAEWTVTVTWTDGIPEFGKPERIA